MTKINVMMADDLPQSIIVNTNLAYEMQPVVVKAIDNVPGR